jgi:hypothetical protein
MDGTIDVDLQRDRGALVPRAGPPEGGPARVRRSSRWSSMRPMTALRDACVEIPSNPKPIRIESGVLMLEPTGKPAASVRVQLFAFGPLLAGCPTVQPSRPVSNDVLVPSGSVTSSRNTPRF